MVPLDWAIFVACKRGVVRPMCTPRSLVKTAHLSFAESAGAFASFHTEAESFAPTLECSHPSPQCPNKHRNDPEGGSYPDSRECGEWGENANVGKKDGLKTLWSRANFASWKRVIFDFLLGEERANIAINDFSFSEKKVTAPRVVRIFRGPSNYMFLKNCSVCFGARCKNQIVDTSVEFRWNIVIYICNIIFTNTFTSFVFAHIS